MFCGKCGTQLQTEWKICPKCGSSIMGANHYTCDEIKTNKNVKFSQQWLMPKLLLIGILSILTWGMFMNVGIPAIIYDEGWITFIVWMFVMAFLENWMQRNLINHAGNEHMMTFGISREFFAKAEMILSKLALVAGGITALLCIIEIANNVFYSINGFCWKSFLEPLVHHQGWILIFITLSVAKDVSMAHRKVTKKDFDIEEKS